MICLLLVQYLRLISSRLNQNNVGISDVPCIWFVVHPTITVQPLIIGVLYVWSKCFQPIVWKSRQSSPKEILGSSEVVCVCSRCSALTNVTLFKIPLMLAMAVFKSKPHRNSIEWQHRYHVSLHLPRNQCPSVAREGTPFDIQCRRTLWHNVKNKQNVMTI